MFENVRTACIGKIHRDEFVELYVVSVYHWRTSVRLTGLRTLYEQSVRVFINGRSILNSAIEYCEYGGSLPFGVIDNLVHRIGWCFDWELLVKVRWRDVVRDLRDLRDHYDAYTQQYWLAVSCIRTEQGIHTIQLAIATGISALIWRC